MVISGVKGARWVRASSNIPLHTHAVLQLHCEKAMSNMSGCVSSTLLEFLYSTELYRKHRGEKNVLHCTTVEMLYEMEKHSTKSDGWWEVWVCRELLNQRPGAIYHSGSFNQDTSVRTTSGLNSNFFEVTELFFPQTFHLVSLFSQRRKNTGKKEWKVEWCLLNFDTFCDLVARWIH